MVRARDEHTKAEHNLLGTGAIIAGVVLGVGVVYLNGSQNTQMVVQAAEAICPAGKDYTCDPKNPPPGKTNCGMNLPCQTVTNGVTCQGTCQRKDGVGKCLSIGSCGGEKLEGKPKEMPKEMGGMPPMLPMIPMKMPKMDMPPMPMPPKEDCEPGEKTVTTSSYATSTGTTTKTTTEKIPCPKNKSGVSSYFSNLFGSASSMGETVKSTVSTAADKLSSFLFGDSDDDENTAREKSGNTGGIQAPSGSGATQVNPQVVVQARPITGSVGESAPSINTEVTGFGAQGSQTSSQSSGLLTAISQTLAGIGVTLRELLSSFAF